MPTLNFADFSRLFEDFERSAVRIESRARTDVPAERPELAAFLDGRLPPQRHREPGDPWSAMTERHAAAGRPVRRVRVMEERLTDYNRYMVYCARASVHHGEDIRFLTRAAAASLDLPDHDFWVFDSARLVELRFTGDDRPLDHDLINDPDLVARHEVWFERAFAAAVPWADYLAEDPSRGKNRRYGRLAGGGRAVPETHNGRVGFGERLRRLRIDADLSGKVLAERLGWPASKVSRLEHGRQTATASDVDALTAALAAPAAVRESLLEDLRGLRVEYATWRRELRSGFASRQRVAHVLDQGATVLRAVQTAVVPGLLQTPDYARAVFEGLASLNDRTDVEAAVRERIRRQSLLYEQGRSFRFVLTEAALRGRVGPRAVHRAQLDRLSTLSGLDTVELAVLPWSTEVATTPDHSFDLFDDRLVLVETFTAELALRDPEDIALYARLFDLYSAAALHGADATAFIARIARELDQP